MNEIIGRQPGFIMKDNHYREVLLEGYGNSFLFEVNLSRDIILLPNGCIEYIWNIDDEELYELCYLKKYAEFKKAGKHLFGIHIDSLYRSQCNKDRLMSWMRKLSTFSNAYERTQCCNQEMGAVLLLEPVHPLVKHALLEIEETKGRTVVETIATGFGYTPRHMERLFLQTFSYGPKRFCQNIRLLNAIYSMLQAPDKNISYHIENLGYSDQAHFQREFKAFTGITPKQFVKTYILLEDK